MSYPGYPSYPQAPGQHPPPQPNAPVHQTAPLSYPIYPGSAAPQGYGFSSPSPYQQYPQQSSPYPSANPAPGGYPQHSTHYPGSSMPAGSSYPASNPTSGVYPSMPSHYPPNSSPYPSGNPPTSSPYPQSSPYPSGNSSPYPSSTYPSGSAPAPYQQQQTSHQASAALGSNYPGSHGGQTSYSGTGRAEPAPLYAQVPPLTSHSSAKTPTPTVRPANPFSPRTDAEILRKAMKGFGTDEKAIIEVLTNRTNAQRQQIALEFKTLYGKDLVSDLKSETSGKLEDLLVALMTPIPDLLAKELNHAISGLGTKEEAIVEIVCTATNYEMKCIKAAYERLFGSSLEQDLYGDTSGSFKRLLISLCQANRNEAFGVDQNLAFQDAQALMRAGELRLGTDESTFNAAILCSRSYTQLAATFMEYQRLTGNDFESAIRSEFSGDIEAGLIAIVHSVKDKSDFFADQLQKSMAGMGTHDRALIRIVCYRSEIDMGDIKNAYQRRFGKSLQEAIADDTSGDYKKCLLSLIA